jgi:ATP-dependent RNA helicase RhlE
MTQTSATTGFAMLGIPSSLLSRINEQGFTTPTPIQAQAIPVALQPNDVIGIAQTGTGKTLAFAIPMLANLQQGDQGLVLAPTRELALQIEETFQKLNVHVCTLIGGANMDRQIKSLRRRPTVIVATPGRLIDHLDRGTAKLNRCHIVVLDEADRMFDMGFAPAIRRIMDSVPEDRQTMLFSATMPDAIADLAKKYLFEPIRVEVATQGTANENIEQELIVMHKDDKPEVLQDVLYANEGTILVFTRTRYGAARVAKAIRTHGHTAAELHSDRTLNQRKEALSGFKSGQYRVLVATDIAARGIDVKDIALVVNYDIPECAEDYVHRIGRTGRAGAKGRAITFASPEQHRDVRDIEKIMNAELPISPESRLELPRHRAPKHIDRPASGKAKENGKRTSFIDRKKSRFGNKSKSVSR